MESRNTLKGKTGIGRIFNACRYSFAGILAAWHDEAAFRQIMCMAILGTPLALFLGKTWTETVLLILPLFLCIIVELLNTAIENALDRISLEHHPLTKKAKDMGSAAQCAAQLFLIVVWGLYLTSRIFAYHIIMP